MRRREDAPGAVRRRSSALLAAGGLGLAILAGVACRPPSGGEQPAPAEPAASAPEPADATAAAQATTAMSLYFPGDERLFAEIHQVPQLGERTAQASAIITALLAGPRGEGLVPPLPQGTTLGGVYELTPGELVVNLLNPAGPPPSGGSLREMLATYSLVDSLVLNLEGVERALILWNDQQPTSFAGHLDTTRPLVADTRLIARAP